MPIKLDNQLIFKFGIGLRFKLDIGLRFKLDIRLQFDFDIELRFKISIKSSLATLKNIRLLNFDACMS